MRKGEERRNEKKDERRLTNNAEIMSCQQVHLCIPSNLLFLLSSFSPCSSALYVFSAHCSLLTAHCSLLCALCSLLSALCSLLSALCSMFYVLCSMFSVLPSALSPLLVSIPYSLYLPHMIPVVLSLSSSFL